MKLTTYKGREVSLCNLNGFVHDIEEIAHSLSLQCRFNGHCIYHYSVAQHSLLLTMHIPTTDNMVRLQALMHDSAEYLTGDIPRPSKNYRDKIIENYIQQHIFKQYGIDWPVNEKVFRWDNRMLATENKQIMKKPFKCNYTPINDCAILYMNQKEVELKFIKRFNTLIERIKK